MKKLLFILYLLSLISIFNFNAVAQCTVNVGSDISTCYYGPIEIGRPVGTDLITGGKWTTSGTGRFSPDSSLNASSYTPSSLDISTGNITLTFTAQMSCGVASANIGLTILGVFPSTAANFPYSINACGNAPVPINAVFYNQTSIQWATSGTGSFNDTNTDTVAYTPSAQDIANGGVALWVRTAGTNNQCSSLDSVIITLLTSNIASLGSDASVCLQNGMVKINPTITDSAHVSFGGGAGTFTPYFGYGADVLYYTPTPAEIAAGTVTLTASIPAEGTCAAGSSQATYTFIQPPTVTASIQPPTVTASPNQSICGAYLSSNNNLPLYATVSNTNSTNYQWTTTGYGTISNSNNLNAAYNTSSTDIYRDTIVMTFTVISSYTGCTVSANTYLAILQADTLNILTPKNSTVCGDSIVLSATSTNINNVQWYCFGGSGNFFPSANVPTTTYYFSKQDKVNGFVQFTFEPTNFCFTSIKKWDSITVMMAPADQTVNAGADQVVPSGNVTLNGTYSGPGTYAWSTNGSGSFTPSNTVLNAVYQPSMNDYSLGIITFTLVGTDNSACGKVSDQTMVTLGTALSISGTINISNGIADSVTVDLYKYNTNAIQYITTYRGFGQYSFTNIPAGSYLIQAALNDSSKLCGNGPACQYLPTYYGDSITWEGAKTLVMNNSNITAADIKLVSAFNVPASLIGTDTIYGIVTTTTPSARLVVASSGSYVQGATVLVLDSVGQVIYVTQTNANGQYIFTHMKIGSNYTIVVDYPGMQKTKTPAKPTTSFSNYSVQMQASILSTTGITQAMNVSNVSIYPNPASSVLHVDLSVGTGSTTVIKLIDVCGNTVASYPVQDSSTLLNIDSLSNGLYIVQITDGTNIISSKFIKY